VDHAAPEGDEGEDDGVRDSGACARALAVRDDRPATDGHECRERLRIADAQAIGRDDVGEHVALSMRRACPR
jgi:hypothetical protein